MTEENTTTRISDIPKDFVNRNFQMNPETDDLIRGRALTNGMIVLLEDLIMRKSPLSHVNNETHVCDEYDCPNLLRTSRWCMVSDLHVREGLVTFVGIYHDGTKMSRTYNQTFFWYVKKE